MEEIPLLKPFMGEEEARAAREAILSTWISGNGPVGQDLEKQLAAYLGVNYAVLVNNCTSALHLALMVLGVREGEVIVPNYTFTSTGIAPALVGARPVLAEVEFDTANIDAAKLAKLINRNTRAIIPVHYAGLPCNMDEIKALAREHDLFVIEDAAQAIGATYKGKRAGALSDVACLSFHASKNMSCGEGGALITNDPELYEKALIMRDKGTNKHTYDLKASKGFYEYVSIGHNFVLSEILAAIALEQFKKLETINRLRRGHAEYLLKGLRGVPGLDVPALHEDREGNWHIFQVRLPEGQTTRFIECMQSRGVLTNTHYVPLHMNQFYQTYGYRDGDFPVSERVYQSLVRLPMYPSLTQPELDRIIDSTRWAMSQLS
jgi:dTDP-4-amino-4,6-dideoxygalactose transaminase